MSTEKMDATGRTLDGRKHTASLEHAVKFAGWPTPNASEPNGEMRIKADRQARDPNKHGSYFWQLGRTAQLAGWPTPKANDAKSTAQSLDRLAEVRGPDSLLDAAKLCGWATPATRDYRTPNHQTYAERGGEAKGEQLNNQVAHVIPGASLNGLHAPTERGGLLNPHHSRWLQGIPPAWSDFAPSPSRRGKRATSQN